MQPSARKPVGVLVIIAGLIVYGGLVAAFADSIAGQAKPVQALIYLVLGVAWLLPLRPLLVWMNR